MKTVLMAGLLSLSFLSAGAFASGAVAPAKIAPQAKAPLLSKVEAKKECQHEGKKGKEFKSCVKGKMEGAQS